jgi:hypothetical protein
MFGLILLKYVFIWICPEPKLISITSFKQNIKPAAVACFAVGLPKVFPW